MHHLHTDFRFPMRTYLMAVLALILALPVSAQPAETGPWTIDHVLKQRSLTDVDIGPNGDRILWVEQTPDPEADETQSDVYLTYRNDPHGGDSTATVQLTRTGNNEAPRWSPDGSGPLFYDVDGNVAEWARTDDGFRAENGSVLTLKNPKAESTPEVPRRATGVRVVLDR
jgi:dipeptidyl aminopeptidase/acylaminoacyl peptidase